MELKNKPKSAGKPNSMRVNEQTGETDIIKAQYNEEQGYGGQQQKVSNVVNNNQPRTI